MATRTHECNPRCEGAVHYDVILQHEPPYGLTYSIPEVAEAAALHHLDVFTLQETAEFPLRDPTNGCTVVRAWAITYRWGA